MPTLVWVEKEAVCPLRGHPCPFVIAVLRCLRAGYHYIFLARLGNTYTTVIVARLTSTAL